MTALFHARSLANRWLSKPHFSSTLLGRFQSTSTQPTPSKVPEADQFGIGGQYVDLDSVKQMRFQTKPSSNQQNTREFQSTKSKSQSRHKQPSQHRLNVKLPLSSPPTPAPLDPADTFGMLAAENNMFVEFFSVVCCMLFQPSMKLKIHMHSTDRPQKAL
jgi:hypothetical protein